MLARRRMREFSLCCGVWGEGKDIRSVRYRHYRGLFDTSTKRTLKRARNFVLGSKQSPRRISDALGTTLWKKTF